MKLTPIIFSFPFLILLHVFLFQVIYLSQIAKEKNKFKFNDVVNSISKKMIFRHPHVFSNKKFKNNKSFNNWWEKVKNKKLDSILDDIPITLPTLNKTYKIQKKVAKVGFDYENVNQALNKVQEELNELKYEIRNKKEKRIKEELGDLIFAVIDLSRKQNYNPENLNQESLVQRKTLFPGFDDANPYRNKAVLWK